MLGKVRTDMLEREKLVELFSDLPAVETDRLLLRPMRTSDASDMFDYAQKALRLGAADILLKPI